MDFQKVEHKKIYEEIADRIKEQIMSGRSKPGDKLPSTRELSESFQVGRSTVREALSALKAMGMVEIRQGEGSYVRSVEPADLGMLELDSLLLSKQTILELLEARKALEVSNAGIAAEKRTEADLDELESILKLMVEPNGNEQEGEKADIRFHLALAKASHNTIIYRMLEMVSGPMEMAIRETRRLFMYGNPSVSKQLWNEHVTIFEAIKEGDSQAAQEAMKLHLFHVEQVLFKYLR